ncbi:MAG: hypothetical protein M1838_001456 [Thelocarpon superellum]|nr:MAG: hypothetical protein M1838_001456 [Thelocarpon superellum]
MPPPPLGESGPKPLKFKPKAPIRRSQRERELAERDEQERIAARNTARSAAGPRPPAQMPSRSGRGGVRGVGWMRGRGLGPGRGGNRAGFHPGRGGSGSRVGEGVASATSSKKRKGSGVPKSESSQRSTAAPSTAQCVGRPSTVPRIHSNEIRGVDGFKHEGEEMDPIYVSSEDDDDEAAGPRVDIEHINLASDAEDGEDRFKAGEAEPRLSWALKPVRLDRREHRERAPGVTTDAGAPRFAALKRRALERGADATPFVGSDAEHEKPSRRRTEKTRDVEYLRNERRWKGVYEVEGDHDVRGKHHENNGGDGLSTHQGAVKDEPNDEADAALPASVPATSDPVTRASASRSSSQRGPPAPTGTDEAEKEATEAKIVQRRKTSFKESKPVLQTEEDRQEWARRELDVKLLSEELGQLYTDPVASGRDGAGDIPMEGPTTANGGRGYCSLYLFQFPPILPALYDPVKKEDGGADADADADMEADGYAGPSTSEAHTLPRTSARVSGASTSSTSASARIINHPAHRSVLATSTEPRPQIKADPDHHKKGVAAAAAAAAATSHSGSGLTPRAFTAKDATLPRGKAGKLTIHASGRVLLSWGGSNTLQLTRAIDTEFLQDVVVSDLKGVLDPDAPPGAGRGGTVGAGRGGRGGVGSAGGGASASAGASASGDGGEERGVSGGIARIESKFIVSPYWEDLL